MDRVSQIALWEYILVVWSIPTRVSIKDVVPCGKDTRCCFNAQVYRYYLSIWSPLLCPHEESTTHNWLSNTWLDTIPLPLICWLRIPNSPYSYSDQLFGLLPLASRYIRSTAGVQIAYAHNNNRNWSYRVTESELIWGGGPLGTREKNERSSISEYLYEGWVMTSRRIQRHGSGTYSVL